MVTLVQRKCYMMAVEAKHSPCETLEKIICNQEMRSSLCWQNNFYMSPTGKCRAQPEVIQLCTPLPGSDEPWEHETTCTANTEMTKSLQETWRSHNQSQFPYAYPFPVENHGAWDEDHITKSFSRSQEISHSCLELRGPVTSMPSQLKNICHLSDAQTLVVAPISVQHTVLLPWINMCKVNLTVNACKKRKPTLTLSITCVCPCIHTLTKIFIMCKYCVIIYCSCFISSLEGFFLYYYFINSSHN